MGMKCFGLPLTALGADSLLSEQSSKTQRWAGVIFRRENLPGVVLRTTFSLRKPGWQEPTALATRFLSVPELRLLQATGVWL